MTALARSRSWRLLVPLGPVAVFGASNFPLAFSVAVETMNHYVRLRRKRLAAR